MPVYIILQYCTVYVHMLMEYRLFVSVVIINTVNLWYIFRTSHCSIPKQTVHPGWPRHVWSQYQTRPRNGSRDVPMDSQARIGTQWRHQRRSFGDSLQCGQIHQRSLSFRHQEQEEINKKMNSDPPKMTSANIDYLYDEKIRILF